MIDLDAIKARVAAATPGPWLIVIESLRPRVEGESISGFGDATICTFDRLDPPDPNARFIALARTDVPALVAEVEHLDALHTSACLRMSEMAEEFGRVEAERDAARAEVERLRAALRDTANTLDKIVNDNDSIYDMATAAEAFKKANATVAAARAALGDAP